MPPDSLFFRRSFRLVQSTLDDSTVDETRSDGDGGGGGSSSSSRTAKLIAAIYGWPTSSHCLRTRMQDSDSREQVNNVFAE
jgi:hypothetical protein